MAKQQQQVPDAGAETPPDAIGHDPADRSRVRAYDKVTGTVLPYPVPRAWLDGRFPNLKETPSSKAGN